MNLHLALAIILPVLCPLNPKAPLCTQLLVPDQYSTVKDIPLPPGFTRVAATDDSFCAWLRKQKLRRNNTVYLYNGMPKRNQDAQFAVLDISIGNQDLQQCADAVMRLRAEYLYAQERWNEIVFKDNAHKAYYYQNGKDRQAFDNYLRRVFSWCGTASLEKQLKPVAQLMQVQPGDVLIKGGFPGHAVMVMDVANNSKGEKIYMLAQGYMPAQDIHLLKNPLDQRSSPWYKAVDNQRIITPEWIFEPGQLRRWPH